MAWRQAETRHDTDRFEWSNAPMFDVVFTAREVTDYRSAMGDEAKMKRCNQLLRERGILKGESKYYISLAHTEADVAFTLDAFAASIAGL